MLMASILREQVLPHQQYAWLRQKFMQEVIATKKIRRVNISERMSGVFENQLTVWFQIQEMVHAERMENEEFIHEMLDVYNELLPLNNELTMTLFIEIPDQEQLRAFNRTVVGIEDHVHLTFGTHLVSSYEPGEDDDEVNKEYTQSVHYLHFPFSDSQKADFLNYSGDVWLKVTHPNYHREIVLNSALVSELKKQLN
jgi:hypothetical protein